MLSLILILRLVIIQSLIRPHSHLENVHILILAEINIPHLSIQKYGHLQTGIQIRQYPQLCLYQALLMAVQKHLLELHRHQRLLFSMHRLPEIKSEFTHPQQKLEYIRFQIQQECTTTTEVEKGPLHRLRFTHFIKMSQAELV